MSVNKKQAITVKTDQKKKKPSKNLKNRKIGNIRKQAPKKP